MFPGPNCPQSACSEVALLYLSDYDLLKVMGCVCVCVWAYSEGLTQPSTLHGLTLITVHCPMQYSPGWAQRAQRLSGFSQSLSLASFYFHFLFQPLPASLSICPCVVIYPQFSEGPQLVVIGWWSPRRNPRRLRYSWRSQFNHLMHSGWWRLLQWTTFITPICEPCFHFCKIGHTRNICHPWVSLSLQTQTSGAGSNWDPVQFQSVPRDRSSRHRILLHIPPLRFDTGGTVPSSFPSLPLASRAKSTLPAWVETRGDEFGCSDWIHCGQAVCWAKIDGI